MAAGDGGEPDVVIGFGGTPTRWTPERLAELPLGLLREEAYKELGPEASLRLLSAYQRAMDQAPEEAKEQAGTRSTWVKGVLGGAAVGIAASLGTAVGVKSLLETHSLVQTIRQLRELAPMVVPLSGFTGLMGAAVGFTIEIGRAEKTYARILDGIEQRIDAVHRQDLAAALTNEELDAIYLQASTRLD